MSFSRSRVRRLDGSNAHIAAMPDAGRTGREDLPHGVLEKLFGLTLRTCTAEFLKLEKDHRLLKASIAFALNWTQKKTRRVARDDSKCRAEADKGCKQFELKKSVRACTGLYISYTQLHPKGKSGAGRKLRKKCLKEIQSRRTQRI